ncbi:MAG: zinc-binding dehydrogenase [Novosphingobium sp.]|nr:zinc-binding dehydrogenase [Novosphingobium sp.]
MKAVYFQNGEVHVGDVPEPTPASGQALVRTHSCGLCASDQHYLHAGRTLIEMSKRFGGSYTALDFDRPVVPGHEFVCEIIDYGPGSLRPIKAGRRVTSVPIMRTANSHEVIGHSHVCPGGFGELMLLDENFLLEIPDAVPDSHASLVEPLAVGLEHARRGHPTKDDTVLVIGCGAIGLGVIVGLSLMGIAPIVAADFNPARREQAIRAGAHIAVDPRECSPYAPLASFSGRQPNLIYECVGKPGMLQQIIGGAPFDGRIVMGGYCMEGEEIFVFSAQNKRLNIQFAAGEEPEDMELALRCIADGKIDSEDWLAPTIGLSGVAAALHAMSEADAPVRTVVDPRMV